MERKVRVVQLGTGKMAKYTMRYVYEKGGEVVGAIDVNPAVIGKDIGEIIGCEEKGVVVTAFDKAEEMLKDVKPDIVIIETMSLLKDLEEPLMLCAKLGINAITTRFERKCIARLYKISQWCLKNAGYIFHTKNSSFGNGTPKSYKALVLCVCNSNFM